jgi:uncharacterized protein (TIGR00290 family)
VSFVWPSCPSCDALDSMKRVLLSWSSGKDSAWTLHLLRQVPDVEVVGLLTTLNEAAQRVAMHAVRRELLEAQARATGLPLTMLNLPWPCNNQQYETILLAACKDIVARGVQAVAFGDLFLRDIRQYRETQMKNTGLEPMFPLWDLPTDRLARDMLAAGLRARITCVDLAKLPRDFAGREFDERLFADLPPAADRCGENGEFHTFCYAGPMFSAPIACVPGEVVEREGFAFADLTPVV